MAFPLGNLPSTTQKQALAGSTGSPATGNEYITKQRFTPVGITPDGTFDVVVDGAPSSIVVTAYGTAAPAIFRGRSARGSLATPTASQSGDLLASFSAKGYGATAFATNSTGRYGVYASENWTDTAQGTKIQIETTSNTTITRLVRAIFTHDGRLVVGATEAATVPALKANSTALEVKLGDDSAYTTLAAGVLKLPGSTSGNITIQAPATAGTQNYTLPSNYGTSGFFLQSDGLGGLTWAGGGSSVTTIAPSTGTSASAAGSNSIAVGNGASAVGSDAVVVGFGATVTNNQSIVLGSGAFDSAANQFIGGSPTAQTLDIYFGSGVFGSASYTIHGSGSSNTGVAGGDITVQGGLGKSGDNTSAGGSLIFQTQLNGAVSLVNRLQLNPAGDAIFGAGAYKISAAGLVATVAATPTTGWGSPAIYGYGRSVAQTAAVPTVATYTVGTSDGSFLVSSNVNVTTYTAGTFTTTVTYFDETNTSQTVTFNFSTTAGVLGTAIATAGPFEGVPLRIRAKASTAITVATTGTFTSLTYNVEADITQVA